MKLPVRFGVPSGKSRAAASDPGIGRNGLPSAMKRQHEVADLIDVRDLQGTQP